MSGLLLLPRRRPEEPCEGLLDIGGALGSAELRAQSGFVWSFSCQGLLFPQNLVSEHAGQPQSPGAGPFH